MNNKICDVECNVIRIWNMVHMENLKGKHQQIGVFLYVDMDKEREIKLEWTWTNEEMLVVGEKITDMNTPKPTK